MTAQAHEKLILPEGEVSMTTLPAIPADRDEVESVPLDEVAELIRNGSIQGIILSTACWRKYIATWEIRNSRLYLVSVEGIFRLSGGTPVFAEWFTGVLRIPGGRRVTYVHMGFESVYEGETLIYVREGCVTEIKETADAADKMIKPVKPPED